MFSFDLKPIEFDMLNHCLLTGEFLEMFVSVVLGIIDIVGNAVAPAEVATACT